MQRSRGKDIWEGILLGVSERSRRKKAVFGAEGNRRGSHSRLVVALPALGVSAPGADFKGEKGQQKGPR